MNDVGVNTRLQGEMGRRGQNKQNSKALCYQFIAQQFNI